MPSIGQFNTVIKDIKHQAQYKETLEDGTIVMDRNAKLPTVEFTGTCKLHGTNASVCMNSDGELWAQSKGNVITPEKDNAGFAFFIESNKEYFKDRLQEMIDAFGIVEVCIYGEWAGKGIQKGVAISELPKTFYAFGIKYRRKDSKDYEWAQKPKVVLSRLSNGESIRSIFEFDTYAVEIDMNNPKEHQNKMLEITEKVDKECPVGKELGVTGHGEGVVWSGWYKDTKHTFKIKGESHSKSRVKTLKPVDEEYENRKITFANYATPAWRLEQALQETFDTLNGGEIDIKRMGDFIRWVIKDILKEEMDKMAEMNLEPKEVNKTISTIARNWFMEQLDKELG